MGNRQWTRWLSLTLQAATLSAQQPATLVTAAESEAVLREQVAKGVVDQPLTATDVPGGKASVAWLHRVKAEAGALIHNDVTETYYIVKGGGTLVTGGTLGNPKPTDLSRVNAGMSQSGTRQGGESRRVGPGDIIVIPAGTPHSFSELDGPISYLVFRFEPKK
jgi:mannose-6-phosphate isomerase-like protein (cupin superfamily)